MCQSPFKFKAYALITRAIEEGVSYGINRAHKHTDSPSRDALEECIEQAVIDALFEIMTINDEDGEQ